MLPRKEIENIDVMLTLYYFGECVLCRILYYVICCCYLNVSFSRLKTTVTVVEERTGSSYRLQVIATIMQNQNLLFLFLKKVASFIVSVPVPSIYMYL